MLVPMMRLSPVELDMEREKRVITAQSTPHSASKLVFLMSSDR